MEEQTKLKTALIVDDEPVVRSGISRIVTHMGLKPDDAADGKEAISKMSDSYFDIIFLDVRMQGMGGMEVLGWIKDNNISSLVVMITGVTEPDIIIQAMKMGAFDYLAKPFGVDDIENIIQRAEKASAPPAQTIGIPKSKGLQAGPDRIMLGSSPVMQSLFTRMLKVAPTDGTVLITGESGTGKELVARAIHYHSRRRENEFVPVDCSALVENLLESELFGHVKGSFTGALQSKKGLFELANHGTFFFDEISNLSMDIQAKLLRVIQEREFTQVGGAVRIKVDLRIMVASNRDLRAAIAENKFREDLFYRLHVIPIHLPPLRERGKDIEELVNYFVLHMSRKIGREAPRVSREAMDVLLSYAWPGNVRELENTIERTLILKDDAVIKPEHLPQDIRQQPPDLRSFSDKMVSLKDLERDYIRFVLSRTNGGIQKAAGILGINRKTLSMKMKKYGL
ncbi:DNA-binding transcriptional response regulator, NtrC family, contains REC, AAA-type ATPase, and a Fis-type DNA-binding domains [Desulfatibacillum alkenivorans DSM 16219]|jgi:DNA-binding NtrC family response regulator|uniref:DNA-binding transcriptional response regulator, NtrC family, contains REC, AAA-type ATPase, and a Fis-type DNA-binding domains n=1 Tax=Desulfatibacillum alkenivorans DSM 16219 TaxID=1121393 RepID=A0A1M6GC44_9BACT|nr:sigma-54 dependent transcriptional regulator [Desulfatibacillum alkenivorans]SHJ07505.1 DNA-binding transcriptional response regulator, NtrC family, contains REC, AAA-type ATPase, and a Fis-type DNA-binding domains [Desulfatibacillum alkenivorans DSM 16219]